MKLQQVGHQKYTPKFRVGLPSQPVPYSPLGSRQQLGVNRLDTMTTWVAAPAHVEHTKNCPTDPLGSRHTRTTTSIKRVNQIQTKTTPIIQTLANVNPRSKPSKHKP